MSVNFRFFDEAKITNDNNAPKKENKENQKFLHFNENAKSNINFNRNDKKRNITSIKINVKDIDTAPLTHRKKNADDTDIISKNKNVFARSEKRTKTTLQRSGFIKFKLTFTSIKSLTNNILQNKWETPLVKNSGVTSYRNLLEEQKSIRNTYFDNAMRNLFRKDNGKNGNLILKEEESSVLNLNKTNSNTNLNTNVNSLTIRNFSANRASFGNKFSKSLTNFKKGS